MYILYNGDCLEVMKDIPDKSIDLVLIDPPYNINKAKWDKWKTVEDYVNFMGLVFLECQRVLKDNGSFYFFHNDFLQMAELQHWIRNNTKFIFKSLNVWVKNNFRAFVWKNPSEKNNLRSWFNICEYCLYYTFESKTGAERIQSDPNCYREIKDYFISERNKLEMSTKQLIDLSETYLGKRNTAISHAFADSQFLLPSKNVYEKLFQKINSNIFKRPYQDIRKQYNELKQSYNGLRKGYESKRCVHNLDKNHNNVWKSDERYYARLHPTQKPLDILERIIKTSLNEGQTALDCFMGSGSTGVACINTNRNFIGIELDKEYFEIARNRIENTNTN